MPLNREIPTALHYLVPGIAGGIVCFAFSRVMVEPLIGAAVGYEGDREHAEAQLFGSDHHHGHELFGRSVQENIGAAVGTIAFAVAMGVLFAVAYTVIRSVLERRGAAADPTGLALLLAGGNELLLSDAEMLAVQLVKSGCRCELVIEEGLWHVYVLFGIPEARAAMDRIAAFLELWA